MNNHRPSRVAYYTDVLRSLVEGRKIILAMGPIGAARPWIKVLHSLGAVGPLVLADSCEGMVQSQPIDARDPRYCSMGDGTNTDAEGAFHQYVAELKNPSERVRRAVDTYDPDCSAVVFVSSLIHIDHVAGRPRYDPDPVDWIRLEDKTFVDSFWDTVPIPHAPSIIVDVADASLRVAAECDSGMGTVWSGDTRDGVSFGASLVRWIRTEADVSKSNELFAAC